MGSRHPNYYGEFLIWLGITMACSSIVSTSAARHATGMGRLTALVVCYVTPWFVFKMLRHISIALIENKHDSLYMYRRDYRTWRRSLTFRLWIDSGRGWLWALEE